MFNIDLYHLIINCSFPNQYINSLLQHKIMFDFNKANLQQIVLKTGAMNRYNIYNIQGYKYRI